MNVLVFLTIAAVYLLFSAKRPSNALAGAGILIPFNQYLPTSGIPLGNVLTLVVVALALAVLRTPRPVIGQPTPRLPLPWTLFVLIVLVAYLQGGIAGAFDLSLFSIVRDRLAVLFVCYAGFKLADSRDAARLGFWGCMIGVGAETVFCLLEFILLSGNVTGHMETRNATGAFIATYAATYLGVYLGLGSDPRRKWFLVATIIGTVAVMGTNSRGGVVALGATFLVVLLLKNRLLFVVVLVVILSNKIWMPDTLQQRFSTVDAEADQGGTLARRFRIWGAGFTVFKHRPFGAGLGQFGPAVATYNDDELVLSPITGEGRAAHNEVVLVLVELGLQGLLVFCLLLAALGMRAFNTFRRERDSVLAGAGLGTVCGLLAGFVASMSLTLLMRPDISGALWILLGICARRAFDLRRVSKPAPLQTLATTDSREPTTFSFPRDSAH